MPYGVYVFDRDLKLVRRGHTGHPWSFRVYGLYEVRSGDPSFPEQYRGQWCLAIGVRSRFDAFDPARPIRLVGHLDLSRRKDDAPSDKSGARFNAVMPWIVEWEDDPDELTDWQWDVDEDAELEIRPAEAELTR